MTRLTNAARREMVREIMADVPVVDYKTQIAKRCLDLALLNLPRGALLLWSNVETRPLLRTHSLNFYRDPENGDYRSAAYATIPGHDDYDDTIKGNAEIKQMLADLAEQSAKREELQSELSVSLASVPNHEELAKRFPELRQYLPEHSPAKLNLPTTTDLMDHLKAAGLELDKALEVA